MTHKSLLRIVLEPLAIAVIGALALRTAVAAFSIPSASMNPTLQEGDHILVTSYDGPFWHSRPGRGDVIVFRHGSEILVKRVVALPCETVEVRNRDVLINDRVFPEPWVRSPLDNGAVPPARLGTESYFVLGDNRLQSLDSRVWGAVERKSIIGRARVIFWSTEGAAASGVTAAASTSEKGGSRIAPAHVRWRRLFSLIR